MENDNVDGGALRQQLEAALSERDTNAAAARELAFVKAGIDTDSVLGRLFFDAYKGPVETDAIKTAAAEVPGLIAPAAPAATAEPTPEPAPVTPDSGDVALGELRSRLSGAATEPSVGEPVHPIEAGIVAFNNALAKGDTRQDAAARFFSEVFTAAHNGDERVLIDARDGRATLEALGQ